jgi:hypothetical protein
MYCSNPDDGRSASGPDANQEAAAIAPPLSGQPCAEIIDDLSQKGSWASFFHACQSAPVGGGSIAHYAGGKWTIVCNHGDDVLSAEYAVHKCPGLILAEAIAIGMPPLHPESYDTSDAVQAVS